MSDTCQRCTDDEWLADIVWRMWLAANIATAAGLCASFQLGADWQFESQFSSPGSPWHPGCGREAPR